MYLGHGLCIYILTIVYGNANYIKLTNIHWRWSLIALSNDSAKVIKQSVTILLRAFLFKVILESSLAFTVSVISVPMILFFYIIGLNTYAE